MIGTLSYPRFVGWMLAAFGGFVAITGNRLTLLGGPPWYVFTGLALVVSGALVGRGDSLGQGLYLSTWLATLGWSLWEVGFDPIRLVPRVVGPAIVFLMILLPRMRSQGPRSPRTSGLFSFFHAAEDGRHGSL